MSPQEFTAAAIKISGRKAWMGKLAAELGVDRSTIYRITLREQVPGPVEVALKGLLQAKRANAAIEKEARRLGLVKRLPRGYDKPHVRSRKKKAASRKFLPYH